MAKRLRHQRIRTKFSTVSTRHPGAVLSGWLCGSDSYLWLGLADDDMLALLSGQRLYRLAKAIVRHFEEGAN